jgi:hypothetical protein
MKKIGFFGFALVFFRPRMMNHFFRKKEKKRKNGGEGRRNSEFKKKEYDLGSLSLFYKSVQKF